MGRRSASRRAGRAGAGPRVLEGARVLVTRSPDRAGALVAALRETGAEPLLLPLIDFEHAARPALAGRRLRRPGRRRLHLAGGQQRHHGPGPRGQGRRTRRALSAWLPGSLQVAADRPGHPPRCWRPGTSPWTSRPPGQQSGAGLLDIWPRGPRQRAPAAGRHRRPAAPPGARGPRRLGPGRHRLPHRRLPRRSAAAAWHPRRPAEQRPDAAVLTPADAKAEHRRRNACTPSSPPHPAPPAASTPGCRRWATAGSSRSDVRRRPRPGPLGLPVAAVAEEPTASGLVAAVIQALAPAHPHTPPRPRAPCEGPDMSFPTHRPRRLRTTPAMRRLTAEHRLSARRTHPAGLHPRGPLRAQPHRLDARRAAAHHRLAQARRRRGRGAGRRRHHALRHPGRTGRPRHRLAGPRRRAEQGHPRCEGRGRRRPGRHERRLPRRIHRPRPLRRPGRHGYVDNDATLEIYGADGRGPGRSRRPRARPLRHDGRPDRRDPAGPGRSRARQHRRGGLRRQVRVRVLRPVPRGRRLAAHGRPAHLPDGRRQPPRSHPRGGTGPGRRRRHGDGQARHELPRHPRRRRRA